MTAAFSPSLQRATTAAVALDLAPKCVVERAARACAWSAAQSDSARLFDHMPLLWFGVLQDTLRSVPREQRELRVIHGGARFPRVWCPELSVLDAEVNGERVVWHVPARPGNDITFAELAQRDERESFDGMPAMTTADQIGAAPRLPPSDLGRPNFPGECRRRAQLERVRKPKGALSAWLRSQEGPVLP